MKYEIKGTPLPVVKFEFNAGETIRTRNGAMSWMSNTMQMKTNTGGIGKAIARTFAGEDFFRNDYTCIGATGFFAASSDFPGEIVPIPVSMGNPIVAQKCAFLCHTGQVESHVHFQKKLTAGLFGGEGFILQRFEGEGIVFLQIDGTIDSYNLAPGEQIIVNTGNLAAMDASVQVTIEFVGGIKNTLFGGEGFFNTVCTGPGKVILQTMPRIMLEKAIEPYIPRIEKQTSSSDVAGTVIGKTIDHLLG